LREEKYSNRKLTENLFYNSSSGRHRKYSAMPKSPKEKNPFAVALSKLGASKGGKARADKLSAKRRSEIARQANLTRSEKLSAKRRSEIARNAVLARWANKK
jgi:hypothetical protein